MTRSVDEWVGKNDDQSPPPRVRIRVWDRCGGYCGQCDRKINAGEKWTLEHLIALVNGGRNAESNLGVTCDWCLPAKNAADVAEKSDVYAKRLKHLGIKRKPSRPMAGSRASNLKRKIDGTVVERRP